MQKLSKGYVYFIQMENTDLYKIGKAADVRKRLFGIQSNNPYKLTVYRVLEAANSSDLERKLHSLLEKHRQRGEWFSIEDKQIIENAILHVSAETSDIKLVDVNKFNDRIIDEKGRYVGRNIPGTLRGQALIDYYESLSK